ncbi:MAG TPA: DNA-processing protein DprA, partial [Candidatus Pelethenecus sp.]|nr:DNA-processing protein DprA [Candidatus Pelethenecus sp.]
KLEEVFFDSKFIGEKENLFINRVSSLLEREGSIAFDLMELKAKGIHLLTIYDREYPKVFLEQLGDKAPSILYYIGNLDLLNRKYIGFSGSRVKKTCIDDEKITIEWVKVANKEGYGTISGGASGIDTFATQESIRNNSPFIEFVSDSLSNRAKIVKIAKSLQEGKALLLSETHPYASFNVGMAMARNKYIYLLSHRTIIIKAQYSIKNKKKTGGTWNGAIENLKSNYTNLCVIDNKKINGNKELIELGCPAIKTPTEIDSFNKVFGNDYAKVNEKNIKKSEQKSTKILSKEEQEKNQKLISILKNGAILNEIKFTEKEKEKLPKIKLAINKVVTTIDDLDTGNKTTNNKIIKFVKQKYIDDLKPKITQISIYDLDS